MAYCDSTLAANITADCATLLEAQGFDNEAVIINRADIDFDSCTVSEDTNTISVLKLKTGKKGYKCIQPGATPFTGAQTTLNVGTYINGWDKQIPVIVFGDGPDVATLADGLANGTFVMLVKKKAVRHTESPNNIVKVYGWHNGLRASEGTQEDYSEDYKGGTAFTLQETNAPKSTMWFFATSAADTLAAFEALTSTAS